MVHIPLFGKQKKLETSLLLPLRNIVLLPGITLPVIAGRPRSVAVAESVVMSEEKQLIIAAIRPEAQAKLDEDEDAEIESLDEIYPVATLAVVHKMSRLPIGPIQLIVEGEKRVVVEELLLTNSGYMAKFTPLPALTQENAMIAGTKGQTLEALTSAIRSLWQEVAALNPKFPEELLAVLLNGEDPVQLAYQTSVLIQQEVEQMQALLEQENLEELLRQVLADLQKEVEVLRLRGQILGETKKQIDRQQREFFLRQQLQKIQEALGEVDPESQELEELRSRLQTADLPEAAEKQAKRELARLERIGSVSAESGVIRTYLDWLLEMPWHNTVEDNLDLDNAREVLDADHYGLERVKDRIIEHLATFKLKKIALSEQITPDNPEQSQTLNQRFAIGTVICFAGPPGVGKTSLGRSIARALGRPFERISLGGLRDEAELRGHRRTYIGAMPGRIVQALHRATVNNPVIMLDELDKVGMDYRGDPASVLLEILDPQQNYSFRDLFLDVDFDLSQVLFIGTANNLNNVPPPLLDRLEIVELSSYSQPEKVAIAKTYLLPRQIDRAGLPADAIQLSDSILAQIVSHYTLEAGVRKLEQQLGTICRKVAVQYARGQTQPCMIHPEQLEELLGPKQYLPEVKRKLSQPGVATGLAWTLQGGAILFIEAALLPQGQDLTLTGKLGDVMKESAQIARSYVWSQASALGIDSKVFKANGIHLHVPAGAVPKDGPSAGVTMVSAIASLLMGQPVRNDTAMTGEINLSGEVLAVGGVREKVLAAHRVGIRRVLLPQPNQKDLADVPEDVRQEMQFIFCDRLEQVLASALVETEVINDNGDRASILDRPCA